MLTEENNPSTRVRGAMIANHNASCQDAVDLTTLCRGIRKKKIALLEKASGAEPDLPFDNSGGQFMRHEQGNSGHMIDTSKVQLTKHAVVQ